MALRWVLAALLVLSSQAVILREEPAAEEEAAAKKEEAEPAAEEAAAKKEEPAEAKGEPAANQIEYSKDFEEDWHKEWKNGDFPAWHKVSQVDGIKGWMDRQSDGKPGLVQEEPAAEKAEKKEEPAAEEAAAKEEKAEPAAEKEEPAAEKEEGEAKSPNQIQYAKEFEEDWHKEWKNGDFPAWHKVSQVEGIKGWMDRQSDGKPGFLQARHGEEPAAEAAAEEKKEEPAAEPAAAEEKKEESAPPSQEIAYHQEEFKKDWHTEWKNGDFPSWKKVIKVDGIEGWEDRQSDGKPSPP